MKLRERLQARLLNKGTISINRSYKVKRYGEAINIKIGTLFLLLGLIIPFGIEYGIIYSLNKLNINKTLYTMRFER